jgi:hypothetical protein
MVEQRALVSTLRPQPFPFSVIAGGKYRAGAYSGSSRSTFVCLQWVFKFNIVRIELTDRIKNFDGNLMFDRRYCMSYDANYINTSISSVISNKIN